MDPTLHGTVFGEKNDPHIYSGGSYITWNSSGGKMTPTYITVDPTLHGTVIGTKNDPHIFNGGSYITWNSFVDKDDPHIYNCGSYITWNSFGDKNDPHIYSGGSYITWNSSDGKMTPTYITVDPTLHGTAMGTKMTPTYLTVDPTLHGTVLGTKMTPTYITVDPTLHGTAMWKKMAATYANIFMWNFEKHLIDNCTDKPFLCLCYIYDIFVIRQHGDDRLEQFHEYVNSIHPGNKLTLTSSAIYGETAKNPSTGKLFKNSPIIACMQPTDLVNNSTTTLQKNLHVIQTDARYSI